jgi:hypothetical protein
LEGHLHVIWRASHLSEPTTLKELLTRQVSRANKGSP